MNNRETHKVNQMAISTFQDRVNKAIRIVKEKYPEAELYEIDGIASEGLIDNPTKIDQLRIIFRNSKNSTILIKSTGWDTFGEPAFVPYPWCDETTLNWPLKMDIEEAYSLKVKAGYKSPYKIIALRNPYFIFGINHSEPYIFVDTITEKVFAGD
jgi:hypothetical protein